ncbi:plasmid IncI1-type surface exclusion protein ExcA [Salmonella enterica]|uniref:Ethanolamine utilization protein EutE n=1 Tax=Salmonella enterica subsp. enterica serovar Karamoja TaxID=2500153 RepID=A0A3Q9MXA5_SALET|nr:plasmid IncI1-type surface exclusion protein ExcA [Salmonella enterica]AZT44353.1 hypothetical protein EL007_24140 [Salmonella enterica subsp. enterica serovar Karamoja]
MTQQYTDPYHCDLPSRLRGTAKVMFIIFGMPSLIFYTLIFLVPTPISYPSYDALIILCWAIVLYVFVRTYKNNKKILEIINSVKLEGLFEPSNSDEIFSFYHNGYLGIDVANGTLVCIRNINTKENLFTNNVLVFGFDIHNWRSCELSGNQIKINTNDPRVPYIAIESRRASILFEKISIMRNQNFTYPHSFPGWVDVKAQEAAEARGLNLIPIKY